MLRFSERLAARTIAGCAALALLVPGPAISGTDPFQPTIPQEDVAIVQHARTERLDNRPKEAIAKLLPVVKQQPQYYSAFYGLALAYARIGDNIEAIKYLKKAEAIRDSQKVSDTSIFNTLGWLYLLDGQYMDAETNLKKAASYESTNSKETNSRVYNNLGMVYLTTGRYAEAEESFKKAMAFGSTSAMSNLQVLHRAEKRSPAQLGHH